jgi:hypothetical protein
VNIKIKLIKGIPKTHFFENKFLLKAIPLLVQTIRKLNYELRFNKDSTSSSLEIISSSNSLLIRDVRNLMHELEKVATLMSIQNLISQHLNQPDRFDYVKIVNEVIHASQQVLIKLQPQHKEKFLEVSCEPNAISGEEFLVLLEIGFGSGGKQVTRYPYSHSPLDHLPQCKPLHSPTPASNRTQISQSIPILIYFHINNILGQNL